MGAINCDILISGNGLIGKIAALSLAQLGLRVALIGSNSTQKDHRTTALMMPSIEFLKHLNLWDKISLNAAPLSSLRIIDATTNIIRARPLTFHAHEIGESAFGYNCINHEMNQILCDACESSPLITCYDAFVDEYDTTDQEVKARLSDGTLVQARLGVGADGKNSLTRTHAKIGVKHWNYPQTAFVTTFSHSLPHNNTSTEFHTSNGPCVQVPLIGNVSSLVWVVSPQHATELTTMDAKTLSLKIEQQLGSIVGKVEINDAHACFELCCQYATKFANNRVVLVGEAAHTFPPIGAQGVNISLRDVQDLCSAVLKNKSDPGAQTVLNHYHNSRRSDIMTRLYAVDALNKSLLSPFLPVHAARALGMKLLDRVPLIRHFLMRQGLKPAA
jgi:2-octaprenyl-6-methoxyphenol hydroxylase